MSPHGCCVWRRDLFRKGSPEDKQMDHTGIPRQRQSAETIACVTFGAPQASTKNDLGRQKAIFCPRVREPWRFQIEARRQRLPHGWSCLENCNISYVLESFSKDDYGTQGGCTPAGCFSIGFCSIRLTRVYPGLPGSTRVYPRQKTPTAIFI